MRIAQSKHPQHVLYRPGVTGMKQLKNVAKRLTLTRPDEALERCVR